MSVVKNPSSQTATDTASWTGAKDQGDGVWLVQLQAPRANALSPDSVKAFSKALYKVEQSDARAVVLTGHPTVFCAGLDLITTDALPRHLLADFVDDFEALFLQLFSLRLPVVAALAGPAVAGGCVLAAACDVRLAAGSGRFSYGVNEVALGLPFPSAALEVAKFGIPRIAWTRALMGGELFDRDSAHALGLIDDVIDGDGDALLQAALARAKALAALPPHALQRTKLDLRLEALTRARAWASESRRIFVEQWFGEHATAKRREVVARLSKH